MYHALSINIENIPNFGNIKLLSLTNYAIKDNKMTPPPLRRYYQSISQVIQDITFETDADSIFTLPTPIRNTFCCR